MIGIFRFVLVVLLLTVVAMTSALVTMHFAIHGAEVSIPNFKGMTAADAGQRAASLGLTLQVENRLYSADVPVGRIANQSPAAGAIVRRGWGVWLTESLGPQKLAIPDLRGKEQDGRGRAQCIRQPASAFSRSGGPGRAPTGFRCSPGGGP